MISKRSVSLMLFTILVTGCSNPLIITPVPGDMVGAMTFSDVQVTTAGSIDSAVGDRVQEAINAQLAKKSKSGRAMNLQVSVDKWKGKDDALGGRAGASLLGVQVDIEGTVKVIDPGTDQVVAEYGVVADYQQGGLATNTISAVDPEAQAIEKFATFTLHQLY